jgi:hypothetical protein
MIRSVALAAVVGLSGPCLKAADTETRTAPQVARDGWKDCLYNGKIIACKDRQLADGLQIVWIDGLHNTYRLKPRRSPGQPSYLHDRFGGLWRRELLPQGNIVLTHLGSGNRITIPLRFPCKAPLKGEVGYCHE